MKRTCITLVLSIFSCTIIFAQTSFYCPPCNSDCDELVFEEAGACDHCGMTLVAQTKEERKKEMETSKLTIAFYLQDRVEILDFAGPLEVFAYAGFNVFTVGKTKDPIKTQGIVTVVPDYSIEDAPQADVLAFFGGNSGLPSNDPEVIAWVKQNAEKAKYCFSVCTGAFILAKAGLLENMTVTTFYQSIDGLKELLPNSTVLDNVRFVDNGQVITTAGVSAGIDGALHFVAKLKGEKAAAKVAEYMEYDKYKPGEGLILSDAKH